MASYQPLNAGKSYSLSEDLEGIKILHKISLFTADAVGKVNDLGIQVKFEII